MTERELLIEKQRERTQAKARELYPYLFENGYYYVRGTSRCSGRFIAELAVERNMTPEAAAKWYFTGE